MSDGTESFDLAALRDRAGVGEARHDTAFRTAFCALNPGLRRYVFALAGPRLNGDAVDDLVAAVWLRALTDATLWRAGTVEQLGHRLAARAIHLFLNARRDDARRATREARYAAEAPQHVEPAEGDVADLTAHARAVRALERAVARLSQTDREILRLRVDAGHSSREVGDRLGMLPGAVDTRLSRIRIRLAEYMLEEGVRGW